MRRDWVAFNKHCWGWHAFCQSQRYAWWIELCLVAEASKAVSLHSIRRWCWKLPRTKEGLCCLCGSYRYILMHVLFLVQTGEKGKEEKQADSYFSFVELCWINSIPIPTHFLILMNIHGAKSPSPYLFLTKGLIHKHERAHLHGSQFSLKEMESRPISAAASFS